MTTAAPRDGFVLATTGPDFTGLAHLAARSLRAVHPQIPVDLFTDQPVTDPVFDRVHALERNFFRPKFEAMRRSRFERTIVLDADIIAVAPIADVFEILGRFDFVAAHEQRRSSEGALNHLDYPLPNAFPQFNGGLMGGRASDRLSAVMLHIETQIAERGLRRDQPIIRQTIYESDLRISVLPPEYNLMEVRMAEAWGKKYAAPRILHLTRLHDDFKKGRKTMQDPRQILGPALWEHVQRMVAGDRTLGGPGGEFRRMVDDGFTGRLRALGTDLRRGLARLKG